MIKIARQIFSSILLLMLSLCAFGQGLSDDGVTTNNIVPNPSFERYSGTPIGWFYKGRHFSEVMKYWNSPTGASPDVFGPKVRVPGHWAAKGFGQQTAHEGKSMVGLTTYGCNGGKPHCREYVQIQLAEPLVKGQNYYAEFWVSHIPRSLQVNNIGLYFSEQEIKTKFDEPIIRQPQVKTDRIVSANNWTKISGKFTAETEAGYLIIGNFFPDQMTKVRKPGANALNYAYYYVDHIIVRKATPIMDVPIKDDDLTRIPLEEGKIVQLKDIFFDTDKSELLPRSNIELNKLVAVMQQHPGMVIEVNGHTDSVGDIDYNLNLSMRRAKSVADYLLKFGISPERTRYRGYGSQQPIADNETGTGRQLNRRVEFVILSMGNESAQ